MRKIIFIGLGSTCVIFGVVGIFLPILPTTPFLLLASLLFANSSKELHLKLLNHEHLGKFIKDYEEKRGIKKSVKIHGILTLWISISISLYLIPIVWVKILLIVIASLVTLYLLKLKTL